MTPEEAARTAYDAIRMGYRLFDSAFNYGNEKQVHFTPFTLSFTDRTLILFNTFLVYGTEFIPESVVDN